MTLHNVVYLIVVGLSTLSIVVHAEVAFDGTLGIRGTLQGPDFAVDAGFGQQVGSNLFHSFETFNLNSTESATFTGPANISNVINRVTGGQVSQIDGFLKSFIPNADMYFLNPAGVMFGPNAAINIPGSLYVSTADYLKLGDTGRFDVITPNNSLLTVAPPSAFGFLDAPGNITMENSVLSFPNRDRLIRVMGGEDIATTAKLSLIGGDISLQNNYLITGGNDVHLISVASSGEVPIDPTTLTDDTFAAYGTISITDTRASNRYYGNIDVSGSGGGEVFIRAGQFFLDNGWVFADTFGDNAGRGINVNVSAALTLQNASRITTEVYTRTEQLVGRGDAGSINIKAGDISLIGGSQINSTSRASGNAGDITLLAKNNLLIKGADSSGAYRSGMLANSLNIGSGGEISISADALIMEDGASIRSETFGFANAGNLSIQANTLSLTNGSEVNVSTGNRQYEIKGATGKAGKLTVLANQSVSVGGGENKSSLLSNTLTKGQGGTIEINSPNVTVHEKGSIQTASLKDGNAGSIVLNIDTLNITQGGSIVAATAGNGLGGNIEVQAQNVNFSGENSFIAASSLGEGDAGSIVLNLGDKLTMRDSFIATSATNADGGNIFITSPNYLYLVDSTISTSVGTGFGGGGNITLQPNFLVQDQSPIIAEAYGGPGGNIDINTTAIYQFSLPSLSRISASSQFGVDGIVEIDTPDNSAEEDVVILSTDYLDVSGLLDTPCGHRIAENLSSFILTASEGASNVPDDLLQSGLLLFKPTIPISSTRNGKNRGYPLMALSTKCKVAHN